MSITVKNQTEKNPRITTVIIFENKVIMCFAQEQKNAITSLMQQATIDCIKEGSNYIVITSSDAKNAIDILHQNKLLNTLFFNQLHKQEPYIHNGVREATSPRFFALEKA